MIRRAWLLALLLAACRGGSLERPPVGCTTCVTMDGRPAPAPEATNAPVFVNAETATFFARLNVAAFWLWVAVSPIGWVVFAGVRVLADLLHDTRTARRSEPPAMP